MAYTEFYCDPVNGSNLNAGSTTSASADATTTNGNWDATTGVFIAASGTPFASTSVGDWASVYNDGATVGVFVGRVTTVTSSTEITVSLTAKMGTAPTTSATGRTVKIGGAWKGPNAGSGFPLSLASLGAATDASGNHVRINLKNNGTYTITTAITTATNSGNAAVTIQGYSSTPGDGGKAEINSSSAIGLLNTHINQIFADIVFKSTASSGSTALVTTAQSPATFIRCVASGGRGTGFTTSQRACYIECEAYDNNKSNSANLGGFVNSGTTFVEYIRCIAHDNTGSNTPGFRITGAGFIYLDSCISDTNGSHGFMLNSAGQFTLRNCDAYNNTGAGLQVNNVGNNVHTIVENCNFIDNGGWGIEVTSSTLAFVTVQNCGFGGGGSANTSGTTTGVVAERETGSITYTTHPWRDPANGDFRILSGEAMGVGRGSFCQTASSYSGTTSYPAIGAAPQKQGANLLINNGMVK